MKYFNLIQICEFLQKFKKLSLIKRVGDNLFKVRFDGGCELFFDMDKSGSNIHKNPDFLESKIYKAPFDILLNKRFNKARILEISVPKNNRILKIKVSLESSYKNMISEIYFEFTGRFTNVIIVDENGAILEALRHIENDLRVIKVGKNFVNLEPTQINEKSTQTIENMEEFLEEEFLKIKERKFANTKLSKLTQIDKKLENFRENLDQLDSREELLKKAANFSQKGHLLSANLYRLNEYDRNFSLSDLDGNLVEFSTQNSPKQSVNEYFNEAKKLKQKAQNLHIQVKNLDEKIEFYENLKNMLTLAKTAEELEILLPKKRNLNAKKEKSDQNIENFYIQNYKISVGKNEKANQILLKNASKDDFWFHIKDLPSSHLIVKTNKQNLTEEIIEFASRLCVNFSAKNSGKYLVDYTKRSNVKVINGAFVNYINYKTVTILKP